MPTLLRRLLFVVVITGSYSAVAASAADTGAPWQTTVLFTDELFEARLLVRTQASFADETWLALEFENKTDVPLELKHVSVSTHRRDFDLASGRPLSSSSLFSGQSDLFSEHPPMPRGQIYRKLAPRQTLRCERMPSDYSAALLGLPHPNGRRIEADILIRIEPFFKDNRRIPFSFEWLYPDEAGIERAEARLRSLLAERDPRTSANYLTNALLEVQRIRQEISVEELLRAVELRHHEPQAMNRTYVLKAIDRHYPKNPQVTEFYRRGLEAGQAAAVYDLEQMRSVWHGGYVESIVRMVEKETDRNRFMLRVLDRNPVDWATRPEVPARLFDALRKIYADVPDDPRKAVDNTLQRWTYMADELRQTRDARVIPLLALGLDDRRKLLKDEELARSSGFGQRSRPQRVCDVALDHLLTVLDGSAEDGYAQSAFGANRGLPKAVTPAEAAEIRDTMITALKTRLAERAKTSK
jgi:hypothetical protein